MALSKSQMDANRVHPPTAAAHTISKCSCRLGQVAGVAAVARVERILIMRYRAHVSQSASVERMVRSWVMLGAGRSYIDIESVVHRSVCSDGWPPPWLTTGQTRSYDITGAGRVASESRCPPRLGDGRESSSVALQRVVRGADGSSCRPAQARI